MTRTLITSLALCGSMLTKLLPSKNCPAISLLRLRGSFKHRVMKRSPSPDRVLFARKLWRGRFSASGDFPWGILRAVGRIGARPGPRSPLTCPRKLLLFLTISSSDCPRPLTSNALTVLINGNQRTAPACRSAGQEAHLKSSVLSYRARVGTPLMEHRQLPPPPRAGGYLVERRLMNTERT